MENQLEKEIEEIIGQVTPEEEKEALTEQDLKAIKKDVSPSSDNWKFHNALMGEHVSIPDIIEKCQKIADDNLARGAALAFIYLSGSRVCEILGKTFKDGTIWKGIRIKDIQQIRVKGQDFLKIRTLIEKHIDNKFIKTSYKIRYKYAYVPVNELYAPFLEILEAYSDTIESNEPDFPLFEAVKADTLYQATIRLIGTNLHIFRHWRATHMVHYHNFTEPDLKRMFGWSKKSSLASNYTHTDDTYLMGKVATNFYDIS